MEGLRKLDLYPKTAEEYRVRTVSGAILSVTCVFFVLYLFYTELNGYLNVKVNPELSVDSSFGELLRINVDVTFHSLPCAYSGLDTMDISGSTQVDITNNIYKQRLDSEGNAIDAEKELATKSEKEKEEEEKKKVPVPESKPGCPSCYGAESNTDHCCKTCEDVREAYANKGWSVHNLEHIAQCTNEGFLEKMEDFQGEGCRFSGFLLVQKVQGNFHISPGKSVITAHSHTHDLVHGFSNSYNMSHTVHRISFGEDFPGNINPLDGVTKVSFDEYSTTYTYFVKVVPTTYTSLEGEKIQTNQYSVTEHQREVPKPSGHQAGGHFHSHALPGFFLQYDLSPIKVAFTEHQTSFGYFLSSLCAIIGGVFTVAGILDSLLYKSLHTQQAKENMGKFG
eukprot:CAMPEP_0201489782 /NCGR_PEP_ID=MMETSP0151_2-20130828/23692_1 /ASSEMBLY_ACC=CAM_ASM_000257 /TAXON_ID=200890 /ORGANISM="Paramoeba atlantica, Strain 621/1 / CCAP 1560/9" /LENGTH=393 /DNA_ID=CAMNT_0047875475 /DNA_START=87 /DNA_END=1268 /DNA_ORIENTATION=-